MDDIPPLYDIEHALAEIASQRRRRDELTRAQVGIADALALHLDRHFAAEELETAGRALVIAAASSASLASEVPAEHLGPLICNLLGFAGARLIRDGRPDQAGLHKAAT